MSTNIEYTKKLRKSGLRPTRQRIKICEMLFNSTRTFHFTINDLVKMAENNGNIEISLATIYNTIQALEKKGHIKKIPINSKQGYYDTNISSHHHFYDEKKGKLIDLENRDIEPIKIKKTIPGKKIKSIEILVKVETDN